VDGYDWIAIPLVPYLYAVDSPDEIPLRVSPATVALLRDQYRRERLLNVAPDGRNGAIPRGEWIQLIGASYDRRIYGFELKTTPEQDDRLIDWLNDRRNAGHFNLFFHNCADFSRVLLNLLYPGMVKRNFVADVGLTTPKHVARDVMLYGERHPELQFTAFVIPQVTGSVHRSRPVRGVVESLVRQKRYLVPLAVLHPELTGGLLLAYLFEGRVALPPHPQLFSLDPDVPDQVFPDHAHADQPEFDPSQPAQAHPLQASTGPGQP
jgi:hypothetical protein